MLRHARWALPLAVVLGLLVAVSPAAARVYPVKDEADLIKKNQTLERANQLIREIHERSGKEVLVETYPSPPPADVDKVRAMDSGTRASYFADLAKKRAKDKKINGLYVQVYRLSLKKGSSPVISLQIAVDDKTAEQFTRGKTKEMR